MIDQIREKRVKAWAVVTKRGRIAAVFMTKEYAKYAIENCPGERVVPVTIVMEEK